MAKKVFIGIGEGKRREEQSQELKEILTKKGYKVRISVYERDEGDEGEDDTLDTDFVSFNGLTMPFSFAFKHANEIF